VPADRSRRHAFALVAAALVLAVGGAAAVRVAGTTGKLPGARRGAPTCDTRVG
jgi:hypothetical protein